MKMEKEKFFKTELGEELKNCITAWDNAIEERSRAEHGSAGGSYRGLGFQYWENTCAHCQAQWEVYKMVLLQFFGVKYSFSRTDECFGLIAEDSKDWLFKRDRED